MKLSTANKCSEVLMDSHPFYGFLMFWKLWSMLDDADSDSFWQLSIFIPFWHSWLPTNTSIQLICNIAFVRAQGTMQEIVTIWKAWSANRVHRKITTKTSQIKCLKTSASNKVILWYENNIYFIYLEKENIYD